MPCNPPQKAGFSFAPTTVLVSEDAWLAALYPGEIRELPDYVRCAGRLKQAIEGHLAALLAAGVSVVLDVPANTVANRRWMRGIFEAFDLISSHFAAPSAAEGFTVRRHG